ncbi:MAG: RDD family protein, partial [Chromatiales bacterium]|nr:RDD family protein [Chromatiales bacterium]
MQEEQQGEQAEENQAEGHSFASEMADLNADAFIEYAGFWRRVAASLIDTILMVVVLAMLAVPLGLMGVPLMMGHSGSFLITDIIPMVIVITLWLKFGATPGKQLLDCQIV